MSIIHLPNGIGDTLGDVLVTASPLEVNGNVWYVHYGTGTDAVSPAGQNRQAPLKTLGQANTNAANGDIIVLMDGHAETFTSAVTISKRLTIVGAGSSGGQPTVVLTNNQAAGYLLSITSTTVVQLRNIKFAAQAQACSVATINFDGTGLFIVAGCYFECGQYDDAFKIIINDGSIFIKNTTFISTATSIATQPKGAVATETEDTALETIFLEGVVIDGGTYGWSNYHALDFSKQAADMVVGEGVSLLRGSDVKLSAASLGYFGASTQTGGVRIEWEPVLV